MDDFKKIIDVFLDCMTIQFTVFNYKLTLLSVFICISLISLIIYAVLRIYR